jgi:DNA-directed RNA polymerase subunit alpha
MEMERKLNMSLAELELSVRATNCLESEGITTVRDLVIRTDDELLEVRNFGETTLREVKSGLINNWSATPEKGKAISSAILKPFM